MTPVPSGMTPIRRATADDYQMLASIGRQSFMESHGHSASPEIVADYAVDKFSETAMQQELSDAKNIYHIIYYNEEPAGYSKIIFDAVHPNIAEKNITKLERIYLLEKFINLKLGKQLLQFNIDLSRWHHQSGMWLFVWMENPRAFQFYQKAGFQIIGRHDFHLSPTHANPNHQMLLIY
jgi:ribosomal protein S18 acetylase RimI-like enzyme